MIAKQPLESLRATADATSTVSVLLAGSAGQGVSLCGDMLVEAALQEGRAADVREDHILHPPSTPAAVTCTVYLAGETDAPLVVPRLTQLDGAIVLGGHIPTEGLMRLRPDSWVVVSSNLGLSGVIGRVVRPALPAMTRRETGGPLVHAMALLGVLSQRLPMQSATWRRVFDSHLPARQREACWDAFLIGRHAKV